jgi:hypothetical protein
MARRLEEMLAIVGANSDENLDDFVDLMRPEKFSRAEMQQIYEETIGHDPTSFFDKKEMGDMADQIASYPETPQEAVEVITNSKRELVESAYKIYDQNRPSYLRTSVEDALEEATGISVNQDDSVDEEEENEDDEDEDSTESDDDEEYDD